MNLETPMKNRYTTFVLLLAGILSVFVVRTILAFRIDIPRIFDLFDVLAIAGSVAVLLKAHSRLKSIDWILATSLGCVVGIGMYFSTLFSPYPFLAVIQSTKGQAWLRGVFTFIATLGGLAIMRQGGPVLFRLANHETARAGRDILFGLLVGLPLAFINVIALQLTEGESINWQNLLASMLDALQPGIVEEVIYRFALWGLLWILLRTSLPEQSAALAGLMAMLVHTYSHFDALFVSAPLIALGMGLAMAFIWGLPLFFLASRQGLESAIAFHWLQDVARFLAGF